MSKGGGSDSKIRSTARSAARASTKCANSSPVPTVFVCDECVELCMDIISEENTFSLVK